MFCCFKSHPPRNISSKFVPRFSSCILLTISDGQHGLRWLGHLSQMDHHRLPRQALTWEPEGFRRRPGRPRQNWKDVDKKDLRKMGISWDEVGEAAEDRRSWRNRVAQCVFDAGWTRNQDFADHAKCGESHILNPECEMYNIRYQLVNSVSYRQAIDSENVSWSHHGHIADTDQWANTMRPSTCRVNLLQTFCARYFARNSCGKCGNSNIGW